MNQKLPGLVFQLVLMKENNLALYPTQSKIKIYINQNTHFLPYATSKTYFLEDGYKCLSFSVLPKDVR